MTNKMLRAFFLSSNKDFLTLAKFHCLMQEQVQTIWDKEIAFSTKESTSEYTNHNDR